MSMNIPADDRKNAAPGRAARFDPLAILEEMSDGVVVVNRNWSIAYLNRYAADTLGLGRCRLGQNLLKAFPAAQYGKLGTACKAKMSQGLAMGDEDFSERLGEWLSFNIDPAADALAIFSRKTNVRKREELPLHPSECGFRAMFQMLSQGVMFQDTAGSVLDSNPPAERILGISRAEIVGRTSGGPFENLTMRIFSPLLQERRWLSVDLIPQFAESDNSPRQLCSLFSDITDQKRASHALRESQAHLALAQRVASVGSAVLDFRTGTVDWSDESYRIYGWDRRSFTPTFDALLNCIHADDRNVFLNGIETARRGMVPDSIEYRIMRPDGHVRLIYHVADLILDASGTTIGTIAISRDITELHPAEGEREIHFYHARRLDALGTLVSGIAHDLNNALVPILGLSETILNSPVIDDAQRPLLEIIMEAGGRARDLVRQILVFSLPGRQNGF